MVLVGVCPRDYISHCSKNNMAEQTIKRLVRTMNMDELRNINAVVVGRIKVLQAKKLKETKDLLKVGDTVTVRNSRDFKVGRVWGFEPVKCRGYIVGVVQSIARTFAKVRVGSKRYKCHISELEKTHFAEATMWFEKPDANHGSTWPTRMELLSKDPWKVDNDAPLVPKDSPSGSPSGSTSTIIKC